MSLQNGDLSLVATLNMSLPEHRHRPCTGHHEWQPKEQSECRATGAYEPVHPELQGGPVPRKERDHIPAEKNPPRPLALVAERLIDRVSLASTIGEYRPPARVPMDCWECAHHGHILPARAVMPTDDEIA